MLTREQLNQKTTERRRGVSKLPIGDLGIQSITERERATWSQAEVNGDGEVIVEGVSTRRARLIQLCAVGEDGQRLYGDKELAVVQQWDAAYIEQAYQDCLAHCGIEKAAQRVGEAEKKSEATSDGTAS